MPSLRILIIDDNPDDRALIEYALREALGECVFIAPLGAEDFRGALTGPEAQLVVTDCRLAWTDGLAVVRTVKARWPDCPVIMFTGTGDEETAVRAMKLGLDDYVVKSSRHWVALGAAACAAVESACGRREVRRLEEAGAQILAAVEATPDLVAMTTAEGRLLFLNRAGRALLGVAAGEDLGGLSFWSFYHDQDAAMLSTAVLPAVIENGLWSGPMTFQSRSGARISISQVIVAHRNAQGTIERCTIVTRDIRDIIEARDALERRHKEERSLQAGKLEAFGAMASGVAGDFNDVISIVMCYSDLLLINDLCRPDGKDYVKQINAAGQRAAQLIQQLINLSSESRGWRALPAASAPPEAPRANVRTRGSGGTILIAEDDLAVRDLVARILARHGYQVLSAGSAPAALRIWAERGHGHRVDLLLTDLVMPGGPSGCELAKQLQHEQPKLKVLYMSGNIKAASECDIEVQTEHRLLRKPFSVDELVSMVRCQIDHAAA